MGDNLKSVREWMQGKKTYAAGAAVILAAVVCSFGGWLGSGSCITLGLWGLTLLPLAAKSNRQHKQVLAAIELAAAAGVALRAGGTTELKVAVKAELPVIMAAMSGSDEQEPAQ